MLPMSTHNVCFYGELKKIIPELLSSTPSEEVLIILFIFHYSVHMILPAQSYNTTKITVISKPTTYHFTLDR